MPTSTAARRYIVQPELEYGLWPNTQLSVKVPIGVIDSSGSDAGVGGVQISEIYNFNAEGPTLPAFSARGDLFLPGGALSGDRTLLSLKAIATRTFGLTRLHLNGAWTFGTSATDGPRLEAPPRWFAGAAVDYTLFRSSIAARGRDHRVAGVRRRTGWGHRGGGSALAVDANPRARCRSGAPPHRQRGAQPRDHRRDSPMPSPGAASMPRPQAPTDSLPPREHSGCARGRVLLSRQLQLAVSGPLSTGGEALQCVRLRPCDAI